MILFADRGLTSHEYPEDFKLYNMNGRLYDPVVGRFLNADPVVQDPGNTQNYNRYSYCLNNPLKYVDLTGENQQRTADHTFDRFWVRANDISTNHGAPPSFLTFNQGASGSGSSGGTAGPSASGLSTSEMIDYLWNRGNEGYWTPSTGFAFTANAFVGNKNGIEGIWYQTVSLEESKYNYRVTNTFFALNPSGQGSDYGWAKNAQTGMGAFDIGNSVKGGMIDYAVASIAGKSMNSLKRVDYVATLGKTGANYVRAFKIAGGATFVASTGISAGLMINYYYNGGTGSDVAVKSGLDITMGVVGLFWPIGTGISATYFIIDAATDGFGGYGDPLKVNK